MQFLYYEHPLELPQFWHLKQAPDRTIRLPHSEQYGASIWKCDILALIAEVSVLRAGLFPDFTGVTLIGAGNDVLLWVFSVGIGSINPGMKWIPNHLKI